MNENVMSQLDAELEHAGEETALSPQMLLLEQLRITPEKELPKMDFLFRLFGKPCFPRRELVAITGKAKSGKTFVTSMLMAVGNLNPNVNPNICQLPLKRMYENRVEGITDADYQRAQPYVEAAEGEGFVIVDEAFAVVVRPAGGSSSFLILFSPEIFAFYPLYKIIIFVVLDDYLYLCTHKSIKLCHSLHGNIRFHKAATG